MVDADSALFMVALKYAYAIPNNDIKTKIFNEIKNNSVFKELQNLLASDFSARVKLIENNYELVEKLGNSFLEKYDHRVKNPFFKQDIYNLEFLKKTTPLIDYNSDNFGEVYELIEKERWYYMSDICTMYEFKVLKGLFDLEIINSKYNRCGKNEIYVGTFLCFGQNDAFGKWY